MFDPQTLVVPDGTRMEERTIVVDGGAIIGGGTNIEYGIIADEITIGEHVMIYGEVSARSDVYIDRRSEIGGTVRANGDAHLGEFTKINGKLAVAGNLDIGDHVSIKDGFEARGWITIRNPIPLIIFLYLYLSELIRSGKDEEVERALDDLFSDDTDGVDAPMMVLPAKSRITLSAIETGKPTHIGDDCRLQGNIRAESVAMGSNTILFGSIRAKDITIRENCTVHGNIDASGNVRIGSGNHVLGDLRARAINIHRSSVVDGTMDAPRGIVVEDTAIEVEEARTLEAVGRLKEVGIPKEVGKPETKAKIVVTIAKDKKHARSDRNRGRKQFAESRSRRDKRSRGARHGREQRCYVRGRGAERC
ncbi:MAG: polymer-forming cytoskeletal protein [Euryarchaeota archaeon]|nr:polymer-forming cytoskeletal protein [Euryarchaeota archaeon]